MGNSTSYQYTYFNTGIACAAVALCLIYNKFSKPTDDSKNDSFVSKLFGRTRMNEDKQMVEKEMSKEEEKQKQKVLKWYTLGICLTSLVVSFGFAQSVGVYLKSGEWSAPPFKYPEQNAVIKIHSKVAILWLIVSTLQPLFLLFESTKKYHRLVGKLSPLISLPFLITAQIASNNHSEPVGPFVLYLQNMISAAVVFYYSNGLYNIFYLGDKEAHKNAMFSAILASAGPGIFRVIRTIREIRSGRFTFDINQFKEYSELDTNEKMDNYQAVQNFYFMAAFVVTGALTFTRRV